MGKLTDNAIKVLERRYLAKNEKGELLETPEDMFRRVARAVAQADTNYDSDTDIAAIEQEFLSSCQTWNLCQTLLHS